MKNFNQFLNEAEVFVPTKEGINLAMTHLTDVLNESGVPFYSMKPGALGLDTIFILVSFEPKEKWSNGYVENSNYFRMKLETSGNLEVFTQSLYEPNKRVSYETRLPIKFRKAKAKTIEDAGVKLLKFIKEIQQFFI